MSEKTSTKRIERRRFLGAIAAAGTTAAVAAMIYAQPKTALEQPEILRTAAGNGDEAVALFIRAEPGYPEDIPVADRELGQQDLAQSTAAMEINAYAAAARGEANVRVPDEVLEPQF